jgi:hypothetical protein
MKADNTVGRRPSAWWLKKAQKQHEQTDCGHAADTGEWGEKVMRGAKDWMVKLLLDHQSPNDLSKLAKRNRRQTRKDLKQMTQDPSTPPVETTRAQAEAQLNYEVERVLDETIMDAIPVEERSSEDIDRDLMTALMEEQNPVAGSPGIGNLATVSCTNRSGRIMWGEGPEDQLSSVNDCEQHTPVMMFQAKDGIPEIPGKKPVRAKHRPGRRRVKVLDDSGASRCFVSLSHVTRNRIPTEKAKCPITVTLADGHKVQVDRVAVMQLDFGQGYVFTERFFVMDTGDAFQYILGTPWRKSLRSFHTDMQERTLSFRHKGSPVSLKCRSDI